MILNCEMYLNGCVNCDSVIWLWLDEYDW